MLKKAFTPIIVDASRSRLIVRHPPKGNERSTDGEDPARCSVVEYWSQPIEKCQPKEQGGKDCETGNMPLGHIVRRHYASARGERGSSTVVVSVYTKHHNFLIPAACAAARRIAAISFCKRLISSSLSRK